MSVHVLDLVLKTNLPLDEKMVAITLADWADDTGELAVDEAKVIRKAGLSEGVYLAARTSLETNGLLWVSPGRIESAFALNLAALREHGFARAS